jgi:hypothetical protein
MGSCAAQVFNGVTPERFACLTEKAREAGIQIDGDSGSASRDGIEISWSFDPTQQTLTLQCTSSPFYVPCEMINSRIQGLVAGCP